MDTLYLALFAWFDIYTDPLMKAEQCLEDGLRGAASRAIPLVSLAECLIYYPHWLR